MKKNLLLSAALAAAVTLISACEPEKKTVVEFNPISETSFTMDKNGGTCEFRYEIVNPTQTGEISASIQEGVDWITGLSTQEYGVVRFNVEVSEEDAPKSWADLADPKYKGEIVLANPASSGSAYAQLYMMYKLYGMDFVAEVVKNTTFVASSTAGPDSVARGEYAITVTGEFNIANKIAAGDPVKYVLPEEGTGRRIEGSAILKNCENLEEAQLFIDFMTSTPAFQIVRDECNRRAVSTEVPGPEGLPALSEMRFFPYDTDEAAAIKRDLVQQFNGLL